MNDDELRAEAKRIAAKYRITDSVRTESEELCVLLEDCAGAFEQRGKRPSDAKRLRDHVARLRAVPTSTPVSEGTPERAICRTLTEYREAKAAWNAAGRPGGRAGSPVLDSLFDCPTCGKTRTAEPLLLPALAFDQTVWCTCPAPSTDAGAGATGDLLSPEVHAAIARVNEDCRRLQWSRPQQRAVALATIYQILAATREQGTDIGEAMCAAMFGDGYMLSHQRRLLAIVIARALPELTTLHLQHAEQAARLSAFEADARCPMCAGAGSVECGGCDVNGHPNECACPCEDGTLGGFAAYHERAHRDARNAAAEQAAKIGELEADKARWLYCLDNASWIRSDVRDRYDYMAVPVAKGADLSCKAFRETAIDAARSSPSGGEPV